jgi:hypothetical protein
VSELRFAGGPETDGVKTCSGFGHRLLSDVGHPTDSIHPNQQHDGDDQSKQLLTFLTFHAPSISAKASGISASMSVTLSLPATHPSAL